MAAKTQKNKGWDKVSGLWEPEGEEIKIKRGWSTHEFTEDELDKLFAGEEITFEFTTPKGTFEAFGKIERYTFPSSDGKEIPVVGFKNRSFDD